MDVVVVAGRFFCVGALLLAAGSVVSGEQATPTAGSAACGKVQRVTCDERFTTLELKPKSKDLPVTILSTNRGQFTPAPEEMYRNTEVCATGRVELFAGHRRLVVSGPEDITIVRRLKPQEVGWISNYFRECDEGVERPVLTVEVQPRYTPGAMGAAIQGVVVLEGIVGIDGQIREMRMRRSLDSELGLDQEAVRAVRQWRFTPGTKSGRPVPILVDIEVSFRLTGKPQ